MSAHREPRRQRQSHLLATAVAAAVASAAVLAVGAAPAATPAPRAAIFATADVLSQLDESEPPNYPVEGFLDRRGLTDGVEEVLRAEITQSQEDWCPLIQAISDNLYRYFDANFNPNPARDAFSRDWSRASRSSGCAAGAEPA